MQITENCVVSIRYTLTNSEGESIEENASMDYLHGNNNIVPGLETELTGKSIGNSLKVTVTPETGYGKINPELIQKIPRSAFDGVDSMKVGNRFQASNDDGQSQLVTIIGIQETTVTVDGNFPLAGQTLIFDVHIEDIRLATEEELKCGYVQGKCGCC